MSKRKDIYSAIVTAVDNSTGINYVTREINENGLEWNESRYPGVKIIDAEETKSRLSFPDPTNEDMQSEFYIDITGFVRAKISTDNLETNRGQLLDDIEVAINSSTAIDDLVKDIIPEEQTDDRGFFEGIGWVTQRYRCLYFYNHSSP